MKKKKSIIPLKYCHDTIYAILGGVFVNAYLQGQLHQNMDTGVIEEVEKMIIKLLAKKEKKKDVIPYTHVVNKDKIYGKNK